MTNYPVIKITREMVIKEDTVIKGFVERFAQKEKHKEPDKAA
jgi:hypothetical protein